MDNKKYYFHNLPTVSGNTKLIKIFQASQIIISANNSNECLIQLTNEGYYQYGKLIDSISFYKDNNNYYVVKNSSSSDSYINIQVLQNTNIGYSIEEYNENFSTENLTKLERLNNDAITNKESIYSPTINGETITEYTSKCIFKQNMTQCSLIMISLRNNNNIGGSGLYLLHRKCESNLASTPKFSIETLYADSVMSQFNITPTKNGFNFTNNNNYRYSITEIANI